MALPKIERLNIEILDQWFSVLVDTLNYNLGQIEVAVPALSMLLTTIDTVPINYLKDSFEAQTEKINKSFDDIDSRLRIIESKLDKGVS